MSFSPSGSDTVCKVQWERAMGLLIWELSFLTSGDQGSGKQDLQRPHPWICHQHVANVRPGPGSIIINTLQGPFLQWSWERAMQIKLVLKWNGQYSL